MGRRPGLATVEVMRALAEGRAYGLDIMEQTGLPSGTVYPILARLERDGLAQAKWESAAEARAEGRPRRRYYRLSGAGEKALVRAVEQARAASRPLPDLRSAREAT
jgi:DNA-binding PadR family transcriptional regulator